MRFSRGFVVLFLICTTVWAQQSRLEELEKKILAQKEQIQELENQVDQTPQSDTERIAERYLSQPEAQDTEKPTMGYDQGFFMRSADSDLELKLKGEIMWQAQINGRDTVQDHTFILRRNRLDAQVSIMKDWVGRIRIGFDQNVDGNMEARVREAYIEYVGLSFLKARAGVTKIPFSMEFFGDRTDQLAIAYSPFLTFASMPRRDAGIMIYGDGLPFLTGEFFSDYMSYAVGVFNGDSDQERNPRRQDNDGVVASNADDDFMFLGAVRFFPLTMEEKQVFFHGAIFFNDTEFREDGARILLDGLQNHEVYSRDLPLVGEDLDDTNGKQFGVDLGFQYWADNLRLNMEFMYIRMERARDNQGQDPDFPGISGMLADREDLEMFGFSGAISYFFELPCGEGMGFEPFFKFSFTTIDDYKNVDYTGATSQPLGTMSDGRGQDIWEVVFGARVHLNTHTRFDFNYIMYDLKENAAGLSNHNGGGGDILHSFMFQVMARW